MALWDVAMAPLRAAGGAFHELDMATQGTSAKRERDQRQLMSDLQVVANTTPDNSPARVEAMQQVLAKHGMSMPTMLDADGRNQYEQFPTAYERGMGQYAEAKAKSTGTGDPVKKAAAVSKLMAARPWTGEEGDVYDPNNPEHRLWMRSIEDLEGQPEPAAASAAPQPASTNPARTANPAQSSLQARQAIEDAVAQARSARPQPPSAAPQNAPTKFQSVPPTRAPTTGAALSQIEPSGQWRERVRGDRSQQQADLPVSPVGSGIAGNLGNIRTMQGPPPGQSPRASMPTTLGRVDIH